jgi:hypothetical protein
MALAARPLSGGWPLAAGLKRGEFAVVSTSITPNTEATTRTSVAATNSRLRRILRFASAISGSSEKGRREPDAGMALVLLALDAMSSGVRFF